MALLISDEEVRKILSFEDTIEAVEDAYRQYGKGLAAGNSLRHGSPLLHRRELRVEGKDLPHGAPEIRGIGQGMAYLEESKMAVLQHSFRLGERRDMMFHLIDTTDGSTLAVIKSSYPSWMRTGAAGAVAAKYLSRKDSDVAGVVGTGRQGRAQLLFLSKVRPIEKAYAHSGKRRDDRFAQEMGEELGIEVVASNDVREVVTKADVLITVTRATSPVVKGEWVGPGIHVSSIGSDCPYKAELDATTLKKADKLVIDHELALDTADIRIPMEMGVLRMSDIHGNIGEVVAGVKPGRESPTEITIFKSTGMTIAYVNIAAKIYAKAKEMGLGVETPTLV